MKIRLPLWLAFATALALGCSSNSGSTNDPPSCGQACAMAGSTNTNSASSIGGTSTSSTGGAQSTGGTITSASGGTTVSTGGAVAAATGGSIAVASGGMTGTTGGASVNATGGVTNPSTGGKAATGGTIATAGATNSTTGGKAATGGAAAANTGGSISTGGSVAVGTGGASTTPTRCSTVSGTVAKSLVDAGAILLDVRNASEYESNGLPGAINIPVSELSTRMTELDKSKNMVVYCASGSRSAQANTQLCNAGYNVFNLGALTNWPQ